MSDAPLESRFPIRTRPAHALPRDYHGRSTIIFVTVCAKDRRPVLANEIMHRHLVAAWKAADHWLVGRYMIMPDHLHFFCAPARIPPQALEPWVRYWKSLATKSLGYGEGGLWQSDFWDVQLRRGDSYDLKWDYVRENPVRAGLVADSESWPFQGMLNELRWRE